MANFEYKIHLSIDESGLRDNVKSELTKIAKEFKNNAFQIEFTGDYKDLIKQLFDLQKKLPNIDLTKGINFGLSDAIKEDTELGQKLLQNLSNVVINSVKNMVSSIEGIKGTISETEKSLDILKKKRESLYDGKNITNAEKAYENAEKRFIEAHASFTKEGVQDKTRVKALAEMRSAYQDMVNLQKEAGKNAQKSQTILNMGLEQTANQDYKIAQNKYVKLGELRKEFLTYTPTKNSYAEMVSELDNQILEEENKLTQLKKNLESAQNPELQVKGKLADNFLEDLQSQLDKMTGLEVKVKPKVDKDVKLEIETAVDVKPTEILERSTDEIVSDTETAVKNFERINSQVEKYRNAKTDERLANPYIVKKRKGRGFENISELVPANPEDVRNNSTTKTGIKRKLDEYLKQRKELETGVTEYGSKTLRSEESLSRALDELAAYTYSFKDAEEAAEIFGKKNKDVFDLVQQRIELAKKAAEGKESSTPYMEGIKWMLEDYGIDQSKITDSIKRSLGEAIETGGMEAFAAKVKELFGVKIPTSIEQAKASIQSINETTSTPPNTSAMDTVEEELREEAQVHHENAEAAKADAKAQEEFNNSQHGDQNNLSLGGTTPSAINEITQAEDRMGNEAQEATEQIKNGLDNVGESAKNIQLNMAQEALEKALGTTDLWYRRITDVNEILSDTGGFFANTAKYAGTYFDPLRDQIIGAKVDTSNMLRLDAKGNKWNQLDDLQSLLTEKIRRKFGEEAIPESTDNAPKFTTKYIANLSKVLGYSGVIIDNVKDVGGYGDNFDELGTVMQVFNKDCIQIAKNLTGIATGTSNTLSEINSITQANIKMPRWYQGIFSIGDFSGYSNEALDIFNQIYNYKNGSEVGKVYGQLDSKYNKPEYAQQFNSELENLISAFELGAIDKETLLSKVDETVNRYKDFIERLKVDENAIIKMAEPINLQSSNKTPVSTEGTSSTISQLEREAEIRQENVAATDAQIEAELKRQSVSSNVDPTDVNTEVDTLIQTQQVATSASEAVSHVKEEVAQTKQEMSDTSTPMLDSIESEANEVSESVDDVNKKIDALANHPFPLDKPFDNQKISAMMSLRNLEDSLPSNYTGDVKQQIDALRTELLQLTEDDGLSIWASKFKIVADNVKDVNNETKALKDNLKNSKVDYSLSLDKSLKIKDLDKYSAKLKELGLYSDETADRVAELYEKLGSVEDKNDLSIYNKELKLLQSELAEQVQIRQQTANAKKINDTDEVQRKIQLLKLQYEYETKLAGLNPETDASSYKIYDDAIKDIKKSVDGIILTEEQQAQVTEKTAKQRIAAEAAVANAKKKQSADIERENNRQVKSEEQAERKRTALLKRLSNLMLNGQIMKNSGNEIRNYFDIVQSEGGRSIDTLNQIEKEINDIEITAKSTGKTGQTMFQMLQQRWQSLAAYLGSFASFYKIIDYARRAVTVVKEFDDALTEMRKVSDESVSTLKAFQQESFEIAAQVGSTAKVIQDSTADWMRLGRVKAYAPLYSNIY